MRNVLIILLLFLLTTFSLKAQSFSIFDSQLYDSLGRLRVDTTLKISKHQFQKWAAVEPFLIENILHRLYYPPILRENNINGNIII